ncbi:ATP-binding protein [Roseicyclus persicicus]|uniref:histidine kinase n=1 Tax=Roseicyclus persicicus TaxID=2650661 RepID=A0A7X6H0Y4_9RHOB|nr:ATP-binding protein [Roseibacterium persicicum]NKX46036.1 two-component sensor histidine kinase [Roseibacterium persicicum]
MTEGTLAEVMEAVPEPMLYLSAEGEVALANPAARALLGDWIVGRSCATVLRQPGLLGRIEAVQAGGAPGEARLQLTDQTGETQFRVRITPTGPAGPRGQRALMLHFTDVTHLREAEEMRRDFVANVSHELRTPLTAVLGFIETLRGPAKDDTAARERFLGIMEAEARRMNRLVSDLLSLSRVEAQERQRPSTEVDLKAVLEGVIAALKPTAEDRGNALALETLPPDPGLIHARVAEGYRLKGDRDQLMQVFLNLTENALKYGGAGKPVTLRLGWREGSGNLKGPVLSVEVIDRGEGIDPLHLPRLTERFYRVDTHRSRAMGGTGLGLAIVKHIVNRHRGRLRIDSRPGQGSVFTVLLPPE